MVWIGLVLLILFLTASCNPQKGTSAKTLGAEEDPTAPESTVQDSMISETEKESESSAPAESGYFGEIFEWKS